MVTKDQVEGFDALVASRQSGSHHLEDVDGDFRPWQELSAEGKVTWLASDAAYYDVPFASFAKEVRKVLGELPVATREEAMLRLVLQSEQERHALEKLLPPYDRLEPAPPLVDRFQEMLYPQVASNPQQQTTIGGFMNPREAMLPYAEIGTEDLDRRVESKHTEGSAGDAWHAIREARPAIAKARAEVLEETIGTVPKPHHGPADERVRIFDQALARYDPDDGAHHYRLAGLLLDARLWCTARGLSFERALAMADEGYRFAVAVNLDRGLTEAPRSEHKSVHQANEESKTEHERTKTMSAWRPYHNVVEGELDNTRPGYVRGWMTFVGLNEPVTFDLRGDFHRDIRGAKIHFQNDSPLGDAEDMREYMRGFARHQTGKVGDITAGLPPQDYAPHPYIEWYSDQNGRVVLELNPRQVQVIGTPRAWEKEKPLSRDEQERNMAEWLAKLSEQLGGVPTILVGGLPQGAERPQNVKTSKTPSASTTHDERAETPEAAPSQTIPGNPPERNETMTENPTEKNGSDRKPEAKLACGDVRGSVWVNQSEERGEFLSVSIARVYKAKDGTMKTTQSFRQQDLPDLIELVQGAQKIIQEESLKRGLESQSETERVRIRR